MTHDKLSSLTRTATPVLSVIFVAAAILFAGPITTATATTTTTTTTEVQQIINLQNSAIEQLSESDRDVNGIEFTPRWGAVSTLQPNQVEPLFAACLEDEFAVSLMYIFQTPDIIAYQSFSVALPDNSMLWLAVVKNTDTNNAGAASIGVICADENDGGGGGRDNLDITTKTIIQNTVKNIINVQNNQIVNLKNVVNVYQQITNYAVQIASITGNNNTVNQVLRQASEQIVNANATAPAQINQIITQEAEQQGVITGGSNILNQTIDQNAEQAANVTGGGNNTVDQGIDQGASQAANVTGGGNVLDQFLGQDADQTANVTGGGNTVDQGIDQGASQAANVTGGGNNTVDQGIDQGASQAANVTGGGGNVLDQFLGQDADQTANVAGE
jgi:hypothetical protein